MIKFPSINQFRSAIKNAKDRAHWAGRDAAGEPIFDRTRQVPKLKFRGTTKLHGTNAAVIVNFSETGVGYDFGYQSRERELTLTSDNAGFALAMSARTTELADLTSRILATLPPEVALAARKIAIFGEWCGGNIQSTVALSQLKKMFCVFAVKVIISASLDEDGEETGLWLDLETLDFAYPHANIFNTLAFGKWEIDIDFDRPELVQNLLGEITAAVEAECPAGKYFGVTGIGEGVVWSCVDEGWRSSRFWFKVKGEAHSVSKVKTLATVDVEAAKSLHEFVDTHVTENRLKQGIDKMVENGLEVSTKNLGDFIRWVFNDVVKEEMDTIVASQLDPKKLGGPIATVARTWFMANYA